MNPSAKIMVVDDEKGICQNVQRILSKNDYEVVCALSAAEALEKMKTESFALMISDIVMPEMNGLESSEAGQAGMAGNSGVDDDRLCLDRHGHEGDPSGRDGLCSQAFYTG